MVYRSVETLSGLESLYVRSIGSSPNIIGARICRQCSKGWTYSVEPDLHLAVSVRSFRAEKLSQFVNELIAGEASAASQTYEAIRDVISDRSDAQSWQQRALGCGSQARGSERYGLVASSGALRLKPEGIHVKADDRCAQLVSESARRMCAPPIIWKTRRRNSIFRAWSWIGSACAGMLISAAWAIAGRIHDFLGAGWRNVNDPRGRPIWPMPIACF